MFQSLLDSMLQCICDLWDAADSAEKKSRLIQGLEDLLERFKLLSEASTSLDDSPPQAAGALPSVASQARDMLSVILGAAGLLEMHEQDLTPQRRAEEFGKIRDAVQNFALLLNEVTI